MLLCWGSKVSSVLLCARIRKCWRTWLQNGYFLSYTPARIIRNPVSHSKRAREGEGCRKRLENRINWHQQRHRKSSNRCMICHCAILYSLLVTPQICVKGYTSLRVWCLMIYTGNCSMMIVDIGYSLLNPCTPWQRSSLITPPTSVAPLSSSLAPPDSAALWSLLLPVAAPLSSSLALSEVSRLSSSLALSEVSRLSSSLHSLRFPDFIPWTLWSFQTSSVALSEVSRLHPLHSLKFPDFIPCTLWSFQTLLILCTLGSFQTLLIPCTLWSFNCFCQLLSVSMLMVALLLICCSAPGFCNILNRTEL